MSEDWTRRYENGRVDTEISRGSICARALGRKRSKTWKPENTENYFSPNFRREKGRENCNLELAEKLGKKTRFRLKMSEDWARRHENGCAGPFLSGDRFAHGLSAGNALKCGNPKIQKTTFRRIFAYFSDLF